MDKKNSMTINTLGFLDTPLSSASGIPQHAVVLHVESDGYLLLGRYVKNYYEYSKAMIELHAVLAKIADTCAKLEFDIPEMAAWLDNFPAFPRLSRHERSFAKDAVMRCLDDCVNIIMREREHSLAKQERR